MYENVEILPFGGCQKHDVSDGLCAFPEMIPEKQALSGARGWTSQLAPTLH